MISKTFLFLLIFGLGDVNPIPRPTLPRPEPLSRPKFFSEIIEKFECNQDNLKVIVFALVSKVWRSNPCPLVTN